MWPVDVKREELFRTKMKETYPNLFQGIGKHWRDGGMIGFNIGHGWEEILEKFAKKVEPIISQIQEEKDRPYVIQVKEKFGGLRVYLETQILEDIPEEIWSAIEEAEREALMTCEFCGSRNSITTDSDGGYWLKTLCKECHTKRRSGSW